MVDEGEGRRVALRGSPERITDHMENFQIGYVTALAAAGGMSVADLRPDPGIDLTVYHYSEEHLEGVATLEISLKSTRTVPRARAKSASVQVRRDRYNLLRTPDPTVAKILVLMVVPEGQDAWVRASRTTSVLHHAAYWVNLDGKPQATAQTPSVAVPLSQLFDDVALCDMMTRIGQGGKP